MAMIGQPDPDAAARMTAIIRRDREVRQWLREYLLFFLDPAPGIATATALIGAWRAGIVVNIVAAELETWSDNLPTGVNIPSATTEIEDADTESRALFRRRANEVYHHMEGEIGKRRAKTEVAAWALELDREP